MPRLILAIVLSAALLLPTFGQAGAQEAQGPALVTVTGKVSGPDRGGLDPFMDAYFNFQQKAFDAARTFTFAELKSLPQREITANAEGWPGPVTASGPLLTDVLSAAGADTDATVAFSAIDGYTVELDAAARGGENWVLAIEANGKPLALGGRGPAWLLRDTGGEAVSADEEARWVWSVILIEAK